MLFRTPISLETFFSFFRAKRNRPKDRFLLFYHLFSTFSAKPIRLFTVIFVPSSSTTVPL
jgi:hypothetical protein